VDIHGLHHGLINPGHISSKRC